jgi:hypothetical protein
MSDDNTIKIRNWVAGLIVTIFLAAAGQALVVVTSITELRANYTTMLRDMADMKSELRQMIQSGTQKRYTSEDATADKKIMLDLLQSINSRVAMSELRLERLENAPRNQ